MIREKHPDIVLLDVCMPVMNGIEVLKSLQDVYKRQAAGKSAYPAALI